MFELFKQLKQYAGFTDRARKVMQLANWFAHYFRYEYITTEHILLGLLQEDSGVAANVLRNLEIDVGKLYLEIELAIEKIVQDYPYRFRHDKLPLTPCVKQVIANAIEEAELLDCNYVGTEHLLLGLLRQKESVAGQVLANFGLTFQEVHGEVLRLVGREIPVEQSSDIPPRPNPVPPPVDGERIQRLEQRLNNERQRIRSLEKQLWNLRVLLGATVGTIASALIWADKGVAVEGLILGGIIAGLGGRILGALAGGITGMLLASVHLPGEGGGLAGALLGALAGFLIAEIGGPTDRRDFLNLWRRR